MPWEPKNAMALKLEFVTLARKPTVNFTVLCQQFGISRKTGYKWLSRYRTDGTDGLHDRSRRPHRSPNHTDAQVESLIIELRRRHPDWGGRTLQSYMLKNISLGTLPDIQAGQIPAASTINGILKRNGLVNNRKSSQGNRWQRFEQAEPNQLWQMDFKGHFALTKGQRCHPLTVLDDRSRFALGIQACSNERANTVRECLTKIFRRYGLPQKILCDNGSPWGVAQHTVYRSPQLTTLTIWLLQLGITVIHGRPAHPQTQGKIERFHRTLNAAVIQNSTFATIREAQKYFDRWRDLYNLERPHHALNMNTPAECYRCSLRQFPETIPAFEYDSCDEVRKVDQKGTISFRGHRLRISKALYRQCVAVRHTAVEGIYQVVFHKQLVRTIDLNSIK